MDYNQYIKRTAIAIILALLLPSLLIVYIDPFQIFHKSFISGMGLVNNQRFQNAGLINSYLLDPDEKYDSVMIGSSVSTNFTTENAASALQWQKPLRLFMDGGDPSQLALILSHTIKTGKIHHVLWEMPPRTYSPPRYTPPTHDTAFPAYLYNENKMDDLHYILNMDILKKSLLYAAKIDLPKYTTDTIGTWSNTPFERSSYENLNSPGSLELLRSTYQNRTKISVPENKIQPQQFKYPVIDGVVLPILEKSCNSNIEFVLFIPPISKIDYMGSAMYVYRSIYMVEYLVNKIKDCRNIRLHAFDTMDFTGDLNNYIDKIHYRPNVSNRILTLMGNHQQVITPENIEEYKMRFIEAVNDYQVHSSYPRPADF